MEDKNHTEALLALDDVERDREIVRRLEASSYKSARWKRKVKGHTRVWAPAREKWDFSERYLVSNHGDVFDAARDKLVHHRLDKDKTERVYLYDPDCLNRQGYAKQRYIGRHRLVYFSFNTDADPFDREHEVRFKRPDKRTCLWDIEFVTHDENMTRAAEQLRMRHGVDHPLATITPETVRQIWRMRADGKLYADITDEIGVSIQVSRAIIEGKDWTHVHVDEKLKERARAVVGRTGPRLYKGRSEFRSEEEIVSIFRDYVENNMTISEIAEDRGVGAPRINDILRRRIYKRVPVPQELVDAIPAPTNPGRWGNKLPTKELA